MSLKQILLKRSVLWSLFLCLIFIQSKAQHFDWAESIGGLGLDVGRAVATDQEGNVFVVGNFTGGTHIADTFLTGYGSMEAFVAKFTSEGNFLWARVISGPLEDMARGVVTDYEGNAYVVGHFTDTVTFSTSSAGNIAAKSAGGQDVFVVKYAPNGHLVWKLTGGGSGDDTATDIDQYRWSGKLYISGGFENRASFGSATILSNGLSDAFLMKMDMSGNAHWIRNGGGLEHDVAASVAVGNDESVYIVGDFYDQAAFGSSQLQAMGSSDMYLAKFTENGNLEWVRTNGGTTVDVGTSVGTDLNGKVFVSGYFQGTTHFDNFSASALSYNDVFVSKFDSDGNCEWLSSAGSWGLDNCLGMAVAWDGSTYLTGFFEEEMFTQNVSFVGNGYDIFVLNFNPDGSIKYGRNAGAASSDFGTGICLGPDQSLYITGYYFFFADFDQITIGNADNGDCFLARMSDILSIPDEYENVLKPECLTYNYGQKIMQISCTDLGNWTVVNTLGQTVANGIVNEGKIDLSFLPTGHYVFRANRNGTLASLKFVVP
ncbi:MAG: T9SS type A sorting domain-containing protein [Flavobacteriales bacterium]|nr:T9SS type A sorting domain-containing protein [Flavobacteriales bacterium]